MGNAAHNFQVQLRRESRLETRQILRQLLGDNGVLDETSDTMLHEKEVATFILKCTKFLWTASNAAQIDSISVLLENVFCEAYVKAGGRYDQALAVFKEKNAKTPGYV